MLAVVIKMQQNYNNFIQSIDIQVVSYSLTKVWSLLDIPWCRLLLVQIISTIFTLHLGGFLDTTLRPNLRISYLRDVYWKNKNIHDIFEGIHKLTQRSNVSTHAQKYVSEMATLSLWPHSDLPFTIFVHNNNMLRETISASWRNTSNTRVTRIRIQL